MHSSYFYPTFFVKDNKTLRIHKKTLTVFLRSMILEKSFKLKFNIRIKFNFGLLVSVFGRGLRLRLFFILYCKDPVTAGGYAGFHSFFLSSVTSLRSLLLFL